MIGVLVDWAVGAGHDEHSVLTPEALHIQLILLSQHPPELVAGGLCVVCPLSAR